MKRYTLTVLAAVLAMGFTGCRKEAPELNNPNDLHSLWKYPSQIFENFWHGMNTSYAFWDIDPTDWDAVYDEYLPKFRTLDQLEYVETDTLEELYTEITKDLIDHHYSLLFYNVWRSDDDEESFTIRPGHNERLSRPYYHERMNMSAFYGAIRVNRAAGRISSLKDANRQIYICSYMIDDVVYLYLTNFVISEITDPQVSEVMDNYYRMLFETPGIKGVILDVRSNGGGYSTDMDYFIPPIIDTDLLIGYSRNKTGLGRLDYGPWVPIIITPVETHRKIEVPIVVLTDIHSASMSEHIGMAVSALPNGRVIGERTYGALGPTGTYNTLCFYFSGSFTNYNISVSTAKWIIKDREGVILEGIGITPDIEVFYDEEAMLAGTDVQLERALEYIATGN